MKFYVSGAMTGQPGLNFPAFHVMSAHLRHLGHTVVNPAELDSPVDMRWEDYMKRDLVLLVGCDAIIMLDGWVTSRGAKLEHHVAQSLGLHLFYEGAGRPVEVA